MCSAGFGFSLFDMFLLLPAFKVGDFLRPCVLVRRILRLEYSRNGWLVFITRSHDNYTQGTAFKSLSCPAFGEILPFHALTIGG